MRNHVKTHSPIVAQVKFTFIHQKTLKIIFILFFFLLLDNSMDVRFVRKALKQKGDVKDIY